MKKSFGSILLSAIVGIDPISVNLYSFSTTGILYCTEKGSVTYNRTKI